MYNLKMANIVIVIRQHNGDDAPQDDKRHIWKILSKDRLFEEHLFWETLISILRNHWISRNNALAFREDIYSYLKLLNA